jgi:Tfp pilus assembly protein PilX
MVHGRQLQERTREKRDRRDRRQQGVALLLVALVLIIVSMLTMTAINHTEQEFTGGSRSRSSTRAFYGADAGVELALNRLSQSPPNLNAFDLDLSELTNVQSRSRNETAPQPLGQVALGETPEGWAVNVGAGAGYTNRVYRVNVTASSGGSTIEVEAKLVRGDLDATGY